MKFDIASDLHLDFGTNMWVDAGADTLVLAGDVVEIKRLIAPKNNTAIILTLAELNEKYKNILWVFGNHEYYDGRIDFCVNQARKRLELLSLKNYQILDNESAVIDGVEFFGTTMWTNVGKRNPIAMRAIASGMKDTEWIKMPGPGYSFRNLTVEDTINMHEASIKWFRSAVQASIATKKVGVFHHAPSFKSISQKFVGDLCNDGYASDLYPELFDLSLNAIVHGHIHDPVDYMMNDIRC
jgi:predicted phosphodiesterase